jgi:hypothetical protein
LCPRPAPATGDPCTDTRLTCNYRGDLAPEGGTRTCACTEDQTWLCTDGGADGE